MVDVGKREDRLLDALSTSLQKNVDLLATNATLTRRLAMANLQCEIFRGKVVSVTEVLDAIGTLTEA